MKNLDFTKVFFFIVSLLILILGFAIPESNATASYTGVLVIISLIVLDIQAPKITKLSEDNPKVKTMRYLSRFIIFIVIICSLYFVLSPIKSSFPEKTNELIIVGFVSLFMMVFGNISPKIPFNRYLGLRLPWTIRDEDTWKIAHRILGYLSFPIAVLQFILTFFFEAKISTITCILILVIIPSLYSLWFYYKKFITDKS